SGSRLRTQAGSAAGPQESDSTYKPPLLFLPAFALPRALQPRLAVATGDAVEGDAERQDRERRHDALPELVTLEAFGHLVAEPSGADEAADDDHAQDHDDPLVDAEHERALRERDPHLQEHLAARRSEGSSGLDGVRRDLLDARLDKPDHDRDGV